MTDRSTQGFTLLELLIVIAIMGFVTMTAYVVPTSGSPITTESEIKKLQKQLTTLRHQALQQGLPRRVLISDGGIQTLRWDQPTGNWAGGSVQNNQFLTTFTLTFDRLTRSRSSGKRSSLLRSEPPGTPREESLIFWPDGTSTGGILTISTAKEQRKSLSVSLAGVMEIR